MFNESIVLYYVVVKAWGVFKHFIHTWLDLLQIVHYFIFISSINTIFTGLGNWNDEGNEWSRVLIGKVEAIRFSDREEHAHWPIKVVVDFIKRDPPKIPKLHIR